MLDRHIVFLVNLLQDLNILRPLVYLAARELDASIVFLVSHKFIERDDQGIWQRELQEIRAGTDSVVHVYDSEFAALALLQNRRGVLIAASESNLSAHAHTHNVFRAAPPGFLKVTLQHGFECVGFLQNRDHYKAHGRHIAFAADVVCGWCDLSTMRSMAASERSKYLLTGPTALLLAPADSVVMPRGKGGMVCENLHSVRMRVSGDFKAPFMDTFAAFCGELGRQGKTVTLRPHPGGQYVLKNKVELPDNVRLNNLPMYKVDLRQYEYGISAPSSVIVDMVLAGVPAAVWQDEDGMLDASNYEGLTPISGLADWLAFERDAVLRPEMLLARQAQFLARTKMLTDRRQVHDQFARLLSNGLDSASRIDVRPARAERVLFVANALIPTLQLSFLKPLKDDADAGKLTWDLLTGEDLRRQFAAKKTGLITGPAEQAAKDWIRKRVLDFAPTTIVFCRYSDNMADFILEVARSIDVPVVFHVDDDLLNVPKEIGEAKYRMHNAPERLAAVTSLLSNADLVYCSTTPLLHRFRELAFGTPMISGAVYCAGAVLTSAVRRPVTRIGYMGFDHSHDLALILPALVHIMRLRPALTFELFGSIPKPAALDEFGDRVTVIPPVRVYAEFLEKFAGLNWDIGLCPLASTDFNRVKANTKWVEYTSVGAAVIATRGMAYDDCCSDGCGELCETHDDWVKALDLLTADPERRFRQVVAAQTRLERDYSDGRLRDHVHSVFRRVHEIHASSLEESAAIAARHG